MGYLVTYLSLSVIFAFQQPDTALLHQSRQQADYYIEQINQGRQEDAHLWALSELAQTQPEIQRYISNTISANENRASILSVFRSDPTGDATPILEKLALRKGSKPLFIAQLLKAAEENRRRKLLDNFTSRYSLSDEGGIQYRRLARAITEQVSIDRNILPYQEFTLTHFFLFKFSEFDSLFTESYVQEALGHWNNRYGNGNENEQNLLYSLLKATQFFGYYQYDNYDQTEPFYSFFFEEKFIPVSDIKLDFYRYLDFSMYRLGFYDRSLDIVRKYTLPLSKYLNDEALWLSILISQAVYLQHIGKIQEAKEINLQVLENVDILGNSAYKPTLYFNLALTFYKTGEFDKYLNYAFQGLDIAREQQNYSEQLDILGNLYHYYRKNKDIETALSYLEKAEKLAVEHGNQSDIGSINKSRGIFYRDFGNDLELASYYFDRSEKYLDMNDNYNEYMQLKFEQAKLLVQNNQYSEALDIYRHVIEAATAKEDTRNITEARINAAGIYIRQNNYEKAREWLAEVGSNQLETLNFEDIIKAKIIKARYLFNTGRESQAYEIMEPAIEQIISRAQYSTDIQSGFWTIEPEYLNAFEFTANLLIQTGRQEEAVLILDELKTINDARLYQNPLVKSSLLNESELNQYRQLTTQLDNLRKKLLASDPGNRLQVKQRIQQLNARKQRLDRKISSASNKTGYTIRDIQNKLSGYEKVLHITELKNQYYIASITRTDVSFQKIDLSPDLRRLFDLAARELAKQKTNLSTLYKIGNILNLDHLTSGMKNITVIPDSYLYQLPLDILPLSKPSKDYSYGEVTYLVERTNIHYLSSLDDFLNPTETDEKYALSFSGYGISDFSNYRQKQLVSLPYATREIDMISDELTNFTAPAMYLDKASTEANFKQTAPQSRIVHLATHSEISQRDPLFSRIYMNKNADEDIQEFPGQVFAYELFELNLNNELIMLNSCESGSGNYLQGSGIMGISRALRYAGAKSLVLNLWSVQDMLASDFAVQFYKGLNNGLSKSQALRQAKLYFLKNKNAEPHYWGPYILIGNDSPMTKPYRNTNVLIATSFMFYLLLLISISIGKEYLAGIKT